MVIRQPLSSLSVITVRPYSSVCAEELAELREWPLEDEDAETEELALAPRVECALAREDALPDRAFAAASPLGTEVITRPSFR